jgi:peptidoglycan/LPS O-acetylase OafA/YrhL
MRVREIDGIRASAVLVVVAHHYFIWLPRTGVQYGWLGVDLFFVISGFLITSILFQLRSSRRFFKTFYGRRAFRIFPPYFFVLAIYLFYSLASHRPGSLGLWAKYIFYYSSLLFSRNQEYDILPFTRLGLAVLWSLSVEEIFYTLWAPVVRFFNRTSFTWFLASIVIMAPVFRWILHGHSPMEVFTFYCRMDGLAFGSLVAVAVRLRKEKHIAIANFDRFADGACILLAVLAVVFFAIHGAEISDSRVTVLGITLADAFFASLVYYVVRHSGEKSILLSFLRHPILASIGMVSYSIYLVHYPLLIEAGTLCSYFPLSRRVNAVSVDILALLLTALLSYGMWFGLEIYTLRLKDRFFPAPALHVDA